MANREKYTRDLVRDWTEGNDNTIPTRARSSRIIGSYTKNRRTDPREEIAALLVEEELFRSGPQPIGNAPVRDSSAPHPGRQSHRLGRRYPREPGVNLQKTPRKTMRPLRLILVALLTAAVPVSLGQSRSVYGRVTDQGGEPLRGAVVQIKNQHNLQVRSYITQAGGDYGFHGLHRDVDYELKAEYDRQSSKARTLRWHDSRMKVRMRSADSSTGEGSAVLR